MQWTKRSPAALVGISIVLAVVFFIFDLFTPLGVAGGAAYIALVFIGFWAPWWYYIFLMAVLASLLTVAGYFVSPPGAMAWVGLADRGLTLVAIWVVAIFGSIIQKSQAKFHTAINNAFDGIINFNGSGIIESFNRGAQKIFGYTQDEILGRNISTLMPPLFSHAHDDFITHYLKTGESGVIGKRNTLKALHKNGTLFPVELSVSESHYGGQLTFVGIVRDITDRIRAEERLMMLSRAIEQSPVSIVITDTGGSIEYVNPKFSETSGYSYEEVIGQNTRILKSLEARPDEYRALWKTISTGGEWRGLFHNRKKTGESYWESASVSPVRNLDGVITHYLSVREDITEQMETEKQLAHALKLEATGQLTSGIAHDFNNLLTIISGNLQLIMEDGSDIDDTEFRDILNDVLSAAQDGEELIHRLLLLLRKNKPESIHVEVNSIIKDLRKVLTRMLGEDIDVSISLDDNVDSIFADPNQMESALLNLAVNARDAMPNGGEFRIETARIMSGHDANERINSRNFIAISVHDNGTGMDAEVAAHACEPFFTTKPEGKGSGLGLSMVHNFVKQAGGHLKVESTPGSGTVIRLFLPESIPQQEFEELRQIPEDIPRGNETILVVEDNRNVRRFAVRSLKNLGYTVLETDNSDQAMQFMSTVNNSIDMLFSDIIIPGRKDGHELALWTRERFPEYKILLTTGLRTEFFDERAIFDDSFYLMRKPYSLEKLAHAIREQLDG